MSCGKHHELFEKIAGNYEFIDGKYKFNMTIYGPSGKHPYKCGESSILYRTTTIGEGGICESYNGPWEFRENKLILKPKTRSQESWIDDETEEGEGMVEDYSEDPIEFEIILEPEVILKGIVFDEQEIELKKV